MLKTLVAAALLASGSAAVAAEPASSGDKLICKRIAGTGWRLSNSNKVCKTKAQWEGISRTNREQFQDYNKGGSLGSFEGGPFGRKDGT